jgi:hypothetical protein
MSCFSARTNALPTPTARSQAARPCLTESAACSLDRGPSLKSSPRGIYSAKNIYIKIAKLCENFPTLNMTLEMLCIAYKKVGVVKLKFKLENFSNVTNLMTFVQIL